MIVTGVHASYYWVEDLARATAFYTNLLGAPPTTAIPDTVSEWTFGDDTSFGLYHGESFHASDGVMFGVPDIRAAIAAAKQQGAQIRDDVEETPVCFMAFGSDSEGNGFILHQRK